jgi:hypothetical protein
VEDGLGGQLRLRSQVVIEVLQGGTEGVCVDGAAGAQQRKTAGGQQS